MKSFVFDYLFEALALMKRRGQRSISLFVSSLLMLISLLGVTTTAWAAVVSSVTLAPPNPAPSTIVKVVFELDTPAVATDSFTYTIGGTAVVTTDYTDGGAGTCTPVAGDSFCSVDITVVSTSTNYGGTIQVTETASSIISNTATITDAAAGGVTTLVSGSIQVLDDTSANISNGETLPIEIGTTNEGGTVSRTFTISNTSTEPLILDFTTLTAATTTSPAIGATTPIHISAGGVVSPEFTIADTDTTALPDVTSTLFVVPASQTVDFDVTFAPPVGTPVGSIDSVVTLVSSASNIGAPIAPYFTFAIRGNVSAAPPTGLAEIDVFDGTTELVDNTTEAIDLGSVVAGGEAVTKTFTIQNPGTGDLSVTNLDFSPVITNFERVDPFPSFIPAGGSADFSIRFVPPPTPGTYTAQVNIDSNDTDFQEGVENPFNFPVTIEVTGDGVTIVDIEVWEDVVDTGDEIADNGVVEVGTTFEGQPITKTFVVRNSADSLINLDLNSVTIQQDGLPFTLMLPADFPDFLTPGQTATFEVQFNAPEVDSFDATIQIFNNSTGTQENPFDIQLTATAKSPVKEIRVFETATLDDVEVGDTVEFTSATSPGVVGTPITKTFTIENIGGTQLKIDSLTFKSGGEGFTLGSFSAKTLDPADGASDSVDFEVTLDAENPSSFQGIITIGNDDEDESPFEFTVTGDIFSSLTEPRVTVWEVLDDGGVDEILDEQKEVIDFSASTNSEVSKTFKIKNIGGVDLDLRILSPLPEKFSLPPFEQFPLSVKSGETVEFDVVLDTSEPGSYGGIVEFFSTDPVRNPFSFPIGATVRDPAPEVEVLEGTTEIASGTTVPVDFGATAAGDAITKVFTVNNTGDADLKLSSLATFTEGGEGFLINSFNPGSVAAGSSTSFTVLLNASEPGTYTGVVSFGSNDADENPHVFPIQGTIDNTPPATQEIKVWHGTIDNIILEIIDGTDATPGTLITFPETEVNVAHEETFTVKNIGSQDLFLTGLTVTPDDSLFEVVGTFPPIVAPQQAVEFRLKFSGESTAERTIQLFNTDPDENPFDFPVTGVVRGDPGSNPDGTQTLTVTRTGEGLVTSDPTGISCGTDAADCIENYTTGVAVALTATPDTGSSFKEWSGDCSGSANPISVTMDVAKSCTAIFTSAPIETLTLTKPAQGTVVSQSGGMLCGASGDACTENYTSGDSAQITAHPDDGFVFDKWGGDCSAQSATNPITLIMSQSFNCTASFKSAVPVVATLTFTKPDNGTISTVDGEIDCGDTCTASYNVGDTIQISATSDAADFSNWEGDCTGTDNPLSVTVTDSMVSNWSCTATFQNKPSAEGDCFVSGGILDAETCIPAAPLNGENTSGNTTDSDVRGGLSKYSGPYKQRDTVTLIDPIKTAGVIKVEAADIGKKADIVVMGRHDSDLYPEGFVWYMMVEDNSQLGWTIAVLPHDSEIQEPLLGEADLKALKTVDALPEYYTAYMYAGNFVYPGPLMIYFGYRVQGEKVILSSKPISITILPPPQ